ncbi:hypothetical protein MASR2M70_19690 [Bacillota bacterium]
MQVDERIIDLSRHRSNKAEENLAAAKILFYSDHFAEAINRSYYAIFHSLRSLLAYDQFDSKKHSGIIAYFNQHYIKTDKICSELSVILNQAFTIRNKSDYDDFFIASKQDAADQISKSEFFLAAIKNISHLYIRDPAIRVMLYT